MLKNVKNISPYPRKIPTSRFKRSHTCIHAHTLSHTHMHTHTCTHMHAHTHTCTHTHTHTHTHAHAHTHIQSNVYRAMSGLRHAQGYLN